MGKKKLTRILALCLAAICLVTTVAALSHDLSGDGKTDVWDLQLAANQGKTEVYADALTEALGGQDELRPNAEGVYEISSTLGLCNMHKLIKAGKDSGLTFRLMNDIDMQGMQWNTPDCFDGTFDGNGHTISNVTVTQDWAISTSAYGMGFFGKLGRYGLVRELNLENVVICVPQDSTAGFVGLLAASVTGTIQDCTTTGVVIDPRTNLSGNCYIGTLAGRIENVSSYEVGGIVITDDSVLLTAESEEVSAISGKSQKVISKLAMDYAPLEEDSKTRKTGIVGWAPSGKYPTAYNWQDISGSSQLQDPILQARRQAVVDKMYEICTIPWTPSQDMTIYYYKTGTGDNEGKLNYSTKAWKAGTTYYGMPYNHGSGSLERFEAWMDEGENGLLTTKTSLPTESFYYTYEGIREALSAYTDTTLQTPLTYTDPDTNKTYDLLPGFTVSDQPLAVGETVKAADHAGFSRYIGNDCSQAIAWAWREVVSSDVKNGGTVVSGVTQMVPLITQDGKTNYQTRYGVLPIGGLVPYSTNTENWEAYCEQMGDLAFYEAYAQCSKGDGLTMFATAGGHSRMVAYDPICIRNYKGDIDAHNSYLITHEQGRSKDSTTTCYADCVYTFHQLYHWQDYTSGIGSRGYYLPMTLPAFHDVDNAAVTSTLSCSGGVVSSNFCILSTTVDGVEVFPSVSQHQSTNTTTRVGTGYRDARLEVKLADYHGDVTGKTVTVKLSNGDVYTVNGSTGAVTKAN